MPSYGELALIITAAATLLAAIGGLAVGIGGLFISIRNSRSIEQVHKATNSMKDELVQEVRESALAQGLKQGRAERKGKRP